MTNHQLVFVSIIDAFIDMFKCFFTIFIPSYLAVSCISIVLVVGLPASFSFAFPLGCLSCYGWTCVSKYSSGYAALGRHYIVMQGCNQRVLDHVRYTPLSYTGDCLLSLRCRSPIDPTLKLCVDLLFKQRSTGRFRPRGCRGGRRIQRHITVVTRDRSRRNQLVQPWQTNVNKSTFIVPTLLQRSMPVDEPLVSSSDESPGVSCRGETPAAASFVATDVLSDVSRAGGPSAGPSGACVCSSLHLASCGASRPSVALWNTQYSFREQSY